jgi:Mn2+/Fe2+ NRAMP family transporter
MRADPAPYVIAAVFVVACLVGLRSTLRLARIYRDVAPALPARDRMILQAFVVVAGSITTASGIFGALAVRRLLGFPPLSWSPFITVVVATIVLFLPLYLEQVVQRIARRGRG